MLNVKQGNSECQSFKLHVRKTSGIFDQSYLKSFDLVEKQAPSKKPLFGHVK